MSHVESWTLSVAREVRPAAVAGRPPYRLVAVLIASLLSWACFARTVTTGTIVANPGASVVVPVTVDSLTNVAAAVVTIGYDPTVVVCLGAEAGETADETKFSYVDSGNGRLCAVFSGFATNTASGGVIDPALPTNVLMNIMFSVRDGTQGLFSDVTLEDVQFGARDGVTDLAADDPIVTVNGMVRSLARDASVAQLEEHFTVWPTTALKSLTLAEGDRIKADANGAAIHVTQAVTATGTVLVEAPLGGWQTGSYALLSTPTEGLSLSLVGATNATLRTTTDAGLVTYWADVVIDGEISIEPESGSLDKATLAQIKEVLTDELAEHPEVKSVTVKGDAALIPVIADLGIAPQVDILGTTATATYTTPTIRITEFSPNTGHVRIKVDPGEGNAIRTVLATGCIHVYGTSNLGEKMKYVSGTSFDLTPYLQSDTKGEADLTISLGTHTFIKVKAETIIKQEGETE